MGLGIGRGVNNRFQEIEWHLSTILYISTVLYITIVAWLLSSECRDFLYTSDILYRAGIPLAGIHTS